MRCSVSALAASANACSPKTVTKALIPPSSKSIFSSASATSSVGVVIQDRISSEASRIERYGIVINSLLKQHIEVLPGTRSNQNNAKRLICASANEMMTPIISFCWITASISMPHFVACSSFEVGSSATPRYRRCSHHRDNASREHEQDPLALCQSQRRNSR